MGVERSVTRWYAQRHLLLEEVAQLEASIASLSSDGEAIDQQPEQLAEMQKLALAQAKLRRLGECPRPMMG